MKKIEEYVFVKDTYEKLLKISKTLIKVSWINEKIDQSEYYSTSCWYFFVTSSKFGYYMIKPMLEVSLGTKDFQYPVSFF